MLHDKDGSHPSAAGSSLAACTLYATLFDDSPVGVDGDAAGVSAAERRLLQQAAWEAIRER